MRNETTCSTILNIPTALALVCVLYLILMHIQFVDLHYPHVLFNVYYLPLFIVITCTAFHSQALYIGLNIS